MRVSSDPVVGIFVCGGDVGHRLRLDRARISYDAIQSCKPGDQHVGAAARAERCCHCQSNNATDTGTDRHTDDGTYSRSGHSARATIRTGEPRGGRELWRQHAAVQRQL